MDKRLIQVKKIFEIEFDATEEDIWEYEDEKTGWASIEFFSEIGFSIENDRLAIGFYSDAQPIFVANAIRALHTHKVVDFDIYENMYPDIQNGECKGMLFGDEADERYRQEVAKQYLPKVKITPDPSRNLH